MNTTLLLYLNNQWKSVDLYEDLPISVVIQEVDLTDFESRKSPYSKQFQVPGTSNNDNIFEHYFEVNGIEFDPLIKIPAVVQYRGTDIFNGVCRLQSVVVTENYKEYEVFIIGDVGDFASELQDLTLRDLDYTDLLHELNYSSITTSWEAKNNDTDGLFGGKILYPLINWGYDYGTGSTPTFTLDSGYPTSFTLSGNAIPEQYFKPAIRVHEVVKRMFAQTSYTVKSEFFETDYFKSIYMDTFLNGQLGVEVVSAVTNQNIFKSYRNNLQLQYEGSREIPLPFNVNFPGGYDPLNNFLNGVGVYKVPYTGQYGFNVRFNYASDDIIQINGDFAVIVKSGTSPTNLTTQIYEGTHYQVGIRGLFPPTLQKGSVNEFPSFTLPAGTYIGVFIREFDDYGAIGFSSPKGVYNLTKFDFGGVVDPFIMWDLYTAPTLNYNQDVDIKIGIPDIQCNDFLKSLVVMFNLVVIQDETNKSLRIEPYNWYYNDDERVERDWTGRLDLSSSYKVEPLSFDLSKELIYTYTKGSDEFLNKKWEDTYNYNYGRHKFVSNSNILTDTQTYEIPFAALPSNGISLLQSGNTLTSGNFIIPEVWKLQVTETAKIASPYSSKPHLFFWVGNRYAYLDATKQQQSKWWLFSGSTPVQQTTYPCVSHLSSLDIYNPSYISDLNFGTNFDFFSEINTYIVQSSPYTLYNAFWNDYISNTYSNETKRLTGKFYLEPIDLYETKLTDKIFVKDSFYRIEKINDGNLIQPEYTSVSLIKERGGYYKVTPPAPYYFVEPNSPYPTLSTLTAIPSYTGTVQSEVCDGTSATGLIYKSGSAPYTEGAQIFTYNGSVYTPVSQGVFVRWTGNTDTFVVINNVGQIIQIDC